MNIPHFSETKKGGVEGADRGVRGQEFEFTSRQMLAPLASGFVGSLVAAGRSQMPSTPAEWPAGRSLRPFRFRCAPWLRRVAPSATQADVARTHKVSWCHLKFWRGRSIFQACLALLVHNTWRTQGLCTHPVVLIYVIKRIVKQKPKRKETPLQLIPSFGPRNVEGGS